MKFRIHIHAPGLVYAGLVALVGLMAMNDQNNLLFWLFGVMAAALLLSVMVSVLMMLGVRARRLDPHHGAVGEALVIRYAVRSRNRLIPIFNVHLTELESDSANWSRFMKPAGSWVMHVGPGDIVHGEAVFWPRRRGEIRLNRLRVWTTFPFGIVKMSVTFSQPQHTLIYPRLYELKPEVLVSLTPTGPLGVRVSQRTGIGDEYFGMREYRPGDSMRNISWKRTAVLDELVCIERSLPNPPRLRVLLDLRTPTRSLAIAESEGARHARSLEEDAISLASSVVHAAAQAGYEVGLTISGTDTPVFPLRRSHWHREKMMAALAGVDLDAERTPSRGPLVSDFERAALVIVHPDGVDLAVGGDDVLHLTASQMDRLTVRAIDHPGLRASSTDERLDPEAAA